MKTRPMALMTSARLPFLVSISAAPRPGVWRGKFSGRIRRGARSMKTSASFWFQAWLPSVIASAPASRNS